MITGWFDGGFVSWPHPKGGREQYLRDHKSCSHIITSAPVLVVVGVGHPGLRDSMETELGIVATRDEFLALREKVDYINARHEMWRDGMSVTYQDAYLAQWPPAGRAAGEGQTT